MLRATTACTFSTSELLKVLRTWCVLYILTWKCASRTNGVQRFISLASLLFDPPEPQIIGKTQWIATFLPFRAPGSSFFWLSLLWLFAALLFHLSILSEVSLLNFLRLYSLLTCHLGVYPRDTQVLPPSLRDSRSCKGFSTKLMITFSETAPPFSLPFLGFLLCTWLPFLSPPRLPLTCTAQHLLLVISSLTRSPCCRQGSADYSKISCLGSDLDGGWWRDVQLLLSTVTLYFPNLSQSFPYPKYPWKIKHRLPSAPSPLAKPGTAQVRCSEFGCFTRTRR